MANGQKKRKLSMTMVDPQFDFQSEEPLWRQQQDHTPPQQQNVFGSNFVRHYPVAPIVGHPKYVEFKLSDLDQVWAMGPNTRFVVSGMFQVITFFWIFHPFFKATIILKKHPKYYPCRSWTICFFE